jgi:DNA replication protein DnaC
VLSPCRPCAALWLPAACDALLAEELTLRENRRIKIALMMARLSSIKSRLRLLIPALARREPALAELEFIDRREVVHFLGPPGTGKSHLSLARGVQAVKSGRNVYFTPLNDLVSTLAPMCKGVVLGRAM